MKCRCVDLLSPDNQDSQLLSDMLIALQGWLTWLMGKLDSEAMHALIVSVWDKELME